MRERETVLASWKPLFLFGNTSKGKSEIVDASSENLLAFLTTKSTAEGKEEEEKVESDKSLTSVRTIDM